jgi:thioredoxin 1
MIPSIKAALKRLFNDCGDSDSETKQPKHAKVSSVALTDDTFEEKVLKSELPVVVDFFASWCGPCQEMGPKIEQLAQEYDGRLVVAKVDTDTFKRWQRQYEVKRIPTLIYFHKGKIVHRTTGNLKIETLRADCDSLLKPASGSDTK